MRKLLILCLALASTAAAETTTIELTPDLPVAYRGQIMAVPFDSGRQFTGISSVSIRVVGTVGLHGWWRCMGTADWQIWYAGAYVAAGFREGRESGMLQPIIVPGSDGYRVFDWGPEVLQEYDETFVFDTHPLADLQWDWSFLECGRAELLVGPVNPLRSYYPFHNIGLGYDPCGDSAFSLASFLGLFFGVTRIEITIESDTVVQSTPSSFGAVKSLFGSGSGQRER